MWLSFSWWPAGEHWIWLKYTWDVLTTIKVGECDIILNILKKIVLGISCLPPKIERYVYTNLSWLYLPFLRGLLWKIFFTIENNEFCKEGKQDSLECDKSGKELLKKSCLLYEQYHFCILNEAELCCRKKTHDIS